MHHISYRRINENELAVVFYENEKYHYHFHKTLVQFFINCSRTAVFPILVKSSDKR